MRIRRMISNLLKPYKFDLSNQKSLYDKIAELEERTILLEEENVETTNVLYELIQDIRALDERINILNIENYERWTSGSRK